MAGTATGDGESRSARHDEILRAAIESNHGYVFQIIGDSFSAAFHNAVDGLQAVLSAQRASASRGLGRNGSPARPHGAAHRNSRNLRQTACTKATPRWHPRNA